MSNTYNFGASHAELFTIPVGQPSKALVAVPLPVAGRVTGDTELDVVLWLGAVCASTTDHAVLDRVAEAAAKLKSTPKELENRYCQYLLRQPGANTLSVAFASIGIGDVAYKAKSAHKRIEEYRLALSVFPSFWAAMEPTPAEQMVLTTIRLPEARDRFGRLEKEALSEAFTYSVNPASLTEVVLEIQYWDWLYQMRRSLLNTEKATSYTPDWSQEVCDRQEFVKSLLYKLPPRDLSEALLVADALKAGLLDTGLALCEEWNVLDHLLRTLPTTSA